MPNNKNGFCVKLPAKDKKQIMLLMRAGKISARTSTRVNILRQLSDGDTAPVVAKRLNVCANTVRNVARRYFADGLDAALYDLPRPGQPTILDAKQKQQIIAKVCSDPPPGYAKWTLMLIVEETKKAKIIESIGPDTIRRLLKEHDLRPWREKNVVHQQDNT